MRQSMKRFLSLCMVLAMVLALLPASVMQVTAATFTAGDTLYLKPNNNWKTDNARFAAYFFGAGETWVSMTDSDGDGYYECTIPSGGYTSVIFCRMNPSTTANNWDNKWNQTGNLSLSSAGGDCYTITDGSWDAGSWSTYTPANPVAPTVSLAGIDGDWDTTKNPMTSTDGVTYTCTVTLNKSIQTFKIVYNGAWYGNNGTIEDTTTTTSATGWEMSTGENNCTLNASGGTYTFTFNIQTERLTVTREVAKRTIYYDATLSKLSYDGSHGMRLYLKPNSNWLNDNARLVAYCFGDGEAWFTMTDSDGDGIYAADIGKNYPNVIFVRMDPNKTENSWDSKWNQTGDLAIPTDGGNCFTINSGTGNDVQGTWSTIDDSGDGDVTQTIPAAEGAAVYVDYWGGSTEGTVPMTKAPDGNYTDVWQADIPGDATHVRFWSDKDGSRPERGAARTKDLALLDGKNCFYGDSSDKALYEGEVRDGYWGNAYNVRKTADVVDIPEEPFNEDSDTMYIGTTFYDYYTDFELNGYDRDTYGAWGGQSYQTWYPFRHFNQALSSYYSSNSVKVPIYVGHFQPDWNNEDGTAWGYQFKDIAGTLDLYGFMDGKAYGSDGNQDQKWFMSVNNSNMDLDPSIGHVYSAAQGIVYGSLIESKLMSSSTVALPYFNEAFLSGTNSLNTKLGEVYSNVQFPFTLQTDEHGISYWTFDSNDTTLQMKQDGSTYYLDEVTGNDRAKYENLNAGSEGQGTYGFFPFNDGATAGNANTYNYGFGTRIDLTFQLTSDGMVEDVYGNEWPIVFEFSGDDDVWVFIDGKLVLDIGGSHGKVTGTINFATEQATVSNVKSSGGSATSGENVTKDFNLEDGENHTLTMFYMERGMWESNMHISFNFFPEEEVLPETTTMTVIKDWDVEDTSKKTEVTVQLQRRVGDGYWSNVGNSVTLNAANKWTHTFTGLDKYTDKTKSTSYEYRVVELNGNTVLDSGDATENGLIVTYGNVTTSTALSQLITNHEVEKQTVVIDFGLPVDITVPNDILKNWGLTGVTGTLVGIGDPSELPFGVTTTQDDDLITSGSHNSIYGSAKIEGGKIRYTLNTSNGMQMNTEEIIGYAIKYTDGTNTWYYYSTVTVIPATIIYYEDNFVSYHTYTYTVDQDGNMGDPKNADNGWFKDPQNADNTGIQAEDRPGIGNLYGYDPAYGNMTTYSLGSAMKFTAKAENGVNTYGTAEFTFYGTGFDVISVTSSDTGFIVVQVYAVDENGNETLTETTMVDTYYGYKYENGEWVVDEKASDALYQVPVIKIEDLTYGQYRAVITVSYVDLLDHKEPSAEGQYDFYLDAIRIYDPANDGEGNTTIQNAYVADGEGWPEYFELRNLIISKGTYDSLTTDSINGVVFIDNTAGGTNYQPAVSDYEKFGPNNELYLAPGQAITFHLDVPGNVAAIHLAMKTVGGGTAKVAVQDVTKTLSYVDLATATDLYYDITDLNTKDVLIFNDSAAGGPIVSITNIKVTYKSEHDDSKDVIPYITVNEATAAAAINALSGMITFGDVNRDKAIDVLDANLIISYYYGNTQTTNSQLMAMDVNGDGEVDVLDANLIIAHYYGSLEAFPVELA